MPSSGDAAGPAQSQISLGPGPTENSRQKQWRNGILLTRREAPNGLQHDTGLVEASRRRTAPLSGSGGRWDDGGRCAALSQRGRTEEPHDALLSRSERGSGIHSRRTGAGTMHAARATNANSVAVLTNVRASVGVTP